MRKHKWLNYCPERFTEIENYEKAASDNFKGWVCHHKLGEHCFSTEELKKFGLYFDRTPGELIFLTRKEHYDIHEFGIKTQFKVGHSKPLSEEHKKHISESSIGKAGTFTGKKHCQITKQAIGKAQKGRRWFTNGFDNIKTYECPEGYFPGITRKG